MGKKKRDRNRVSSKRAQITIFIIVGILILFIFLSILMLTNQLRKGQLQTEQEKVLSKVFQKEALRIFVEDCLADGIEKGLILLGKQGRIWKDQGGLTSFSKGITGITYGPDEEKIAYGITRGEEPFQYPEAYPCATDENAPEFCQYTYPDITVGFGGLELRAGSIQSDLQRYLIEQTVSCVTDFVAINISATAKVEETDIDLKLAILDEGISVQVSYPLKFRLADQEFFQLSEFDFFHPTKFKQLLDSAILFPLEHDQKFVDFQYTDAILRSPFFEYGNTQQFIGCEPQEGYYLCKRSLPFEKYKNLNLNLKILPLEQGDDFFIFSDVPHIVKDKPYTFRIARQNRPPALDYVHRSQCLLGGNPEKSYDYLVIPGDEKFGQINIVANASDPDEDAVEYDFVSEDFTKDSTYPDNVLGNVFFTREVGNPGWYKIIAKAADEDLEDTQTVRVLVDRPITMNLDLKSIYQDVNLFDSGVYFVSREDPITLEVTFPQSSLTEDLEEISLQYIAAGQEFTFPIETSTTEPPLDELGTKLTTLNIPQKIGGGQPETGEDLKNFLDRAYFTTHPFRELVLGKLVLDYNLNYCGAFAQSQSAEAIVSVTACVPHKNPTNPWAYPYHEYTYEFDEEGNTHFKEIEKTANPFQATHTCCVGTPEIPGKWDVAPAGTSCFESPLPDCEGNIPEYTALSGNEGYLLEQKLDYCDGQRGNICGNPTLRKSQLWNDELRCGNKDTSLSCDKVVEECYDQLAWGFSDSNNDGQNDLWCHGKMGCSSVCAGPVVAEIGAPVAKDTLYNMNLRAETNFFTNDEALQVHCECTEQDRTAGNVCDNNFDGIFEGTCQPDGLCR